MALSLLGDQPTKQTHQQNPNPPTKQPNKPTQSQTNKQTQPKPKQNKPNPNPNPSKINLIPTETQTNSTKTFLKPFKPNQKKLTKPTFYLHLAPGSHFGTSRRRLRFARGAAGRSHRGAPRAACVRCPGQGRSCDPRRCGCGQHQSRQLGNNDASPSDWKKWCISFCMSLGIQKPPKITCWRV